MAVLYDITTSSIIQVNSRYKYHYDLLQTWQFEKCYVNKRVTF